MKAQSIGRQLKKGSSTLEIMIAFAILALALSGVIGVVFSNQSISIDTQTNTEALARASTMLEEARALGKADFTAVATLAPSPDDIYQKSLTVEDLSSELKRITSIVSWSSLGRNLSITLTTLLTNPTIANSCSPTPSGNWKSPQHWDYPTKDLLPGNNSNGLGVADIKIYQGKMYVASKIPANNDHTLHIFSLASTPDVAPTYVGSVDNNTSSTDGLNALAVAGNGGNTYAYVANAHDSNFSICSAGQSCSQMQVFDMTSGTPVLKYSLKLTGVLGNMSSTDQAVGNSLYYENGYLYLGLTKTASGAEFHIIDVHNPLAPTQVGSYPVGRTVNSIYVKGNYAYLATSDNVSGNKQLLALDISDKSNPHLITSPVGGFLRVTGAGVGNTVMVNGTSAYFGRAYSSGAPNFYILDISNPATYPSQIPVIKSMTVGTNASVRSISVRGTLAFLMTQDEFQVWDIAAPTNPAPWTPGGTAAEFLSLSSLGGTGTSFNCSSNYFYTAVASSQGNNKDIISIIGPGTIASTLALGVHDALHTPVTTAVFGTPVHAQATASGSEGTPAGTVDFTFYSSNNCSSGALSGGSGKTLVGGTVESNSVTPNTAGIYSYKAHYNGNYQYSPSDSACVPLVVSKADQTVTVTTSAPATAAYNSSFTVAASASSGLTVAVAASGVCSLSGNTVTMTSGSGTCTVTYTQAGNSNYNAAPAITENVTATKAATVTTVSCPASVVYSGAAQTPCTAAVTGTGLSQSAGVTYTNNVNAGTAQANASYPGTVNYSASSGSNTFTIAKATPTITWFNPSAITYGTALGSTQLNATANTPGAFTFSPGAGTILTAGANQVLSAHFVPSNTANYNIPPDKSVTITVNKAVAPMSGAVYNNANAQVTAVNAGVQVYAKAILTAVGSGILPSGTVTFTLYKKYGCPNGAGNLLQNYAPITLSSGSAQSPNFTTTSANKNLSYSMSYSGDSNYTAPAVVCVDLTVN